MTSDDPTAEDERECRRRLEQLKAALDECRREDDGPRFANALEISALLDLVTEKILEADPNDRPRYVALVEHVKQRVTPWPATGGRAH